MTRSQFSQPNRERTHSQDISAVGSRALSLEMPVTPHYLHRAGLRSLLAQLFDECHLRPRSQVVEVGVDEAVAMKVNLATVERLEEAVIGVWNDNADAGMWQIR